MPNICPARNCENELKQDRDMCPVHWRMIPREVRRHWSLEAAVAIVAAKEK